MRKLAIPLLVILALLAITVYSSVYVVKQHERGLVLQLGKIVQEDVQAGLHFRVPFITTLHIFDTRVRTLDGDKETVIVRGDARIGQNDQAPLDVDYYINWQINNTRQFYQSTGGETDVAEELMTQKTNKILKDSLGEKSIQDVVSDTRSELIVKLSDEVLTYATKELGVTVLDVRVERIDLPEAITATAFERMEQAWEEQSAATRADGASRAIAIRAEANRNAQVIKAKAEGTAQEILGAGEATAAATYADAYNRDPEFYRFYRSLQAYEKSLTNGDNVLVIKPDSEFFRYLNSSDGQ